MFSQCISSQWGGGFHLVYDVEEAVDCRQVVGDDGGVSNADALKPKDSNLSDSRLRLEGMTGETQTL